MEVIKDRGIRYGRWFADQWVNNLLFSTGIILLVMLVLQTQALGFNYDSFGDWFTAWIRNLTNVLRNNSGIGIIALGMTFVIISGGIDLAVGSSLVAVGAAIMLLLDTGPSGILGLVGITGFPAYVVAIVLGAGVGLVLGEFTGLLITKGKIPPFIATLGTMQLFRSVTQHFMQGYNPAVPRGFLPLASFRIGNLMLMPIIYWIIIAVIMYIVATRTVFGRQVYAIGSNERTARLSGINVNRVKRRVYVLMGVLVSFSAIIQVARIGSMDYANAGAGYELDAIAAVIVGGTSFSGGKGSMIGTVLGVMIIAVMNNLLNLWGVPPFLREAFKGAIVIAAVLMQRKEKEI
ncbi:MAG: ABC transporter permease [Anaerovoracaceae bacterium]|jgi:ribose transport system permease protein|nr:ABC transporter permease [Anaerovoracaceae bacterium]